MDVGNVNSATVSAASQAKTGDAVAISVLKKSLDAQAQGAAQLIDALPQPSANNPPNLGNKINVLA